MIFASRDKHCSSVSSVESARSNRMVSFICKGKEKVVLKSNFDRDICSIRLFLIDSRLVIDADV